MFQAARQLGQGNTRAAGKRRIPNLCHAVRQLGQGNTRAAPKRKIPNLCHAARQLGQLKILAVVKRRIPNLCHAVREGQRLQFCLLALHHARIILYRGQVRHAGQVEGRQTVPAAAFVIQVDQVLPVIAGDLRRAASEFDGGNVRFIVARQRGFNGRFHFVVVFVRAARAVSVKGHGENAALKGKRDCPANQHINLRQLHAVGQRITGWKNRRKEIAALFGGVVPRAVRFPRHAGYGDCLRLRVGIVGHDIAGRAQRGG